MRCSLSLLLRSAMLLFALTVFCAVSAFPQDPPSVAMGMSPSATYHGGDFDFVDMATGRLHLQIPVIADHSQRGNLNFTYTVTFTSNGIWTGVAQPPQYIIWLIEPPKYGISGPTLVPEGALNSSMWVDVYNDGTDRYYAYSVFEDGAGNGTKHPMGLITGNQNSGSSTWESIDGSGIYAPKNIAGAAVETKEGLGFTSSSITDTNGNVITLGGSLATDTLGRAWTATYNSTNVSGCPTGGPVAPSSAATRLEIADCV